MLGTRTNIVYHVLLDRLGQNGGSDSVGGTAVLSLNYYYLWPFCGSTYSCPDSVGSTAGLSLRNHYSGLSVAQQLLVTLSPSLRPVLPVVLEVDSRTILEVEVDTCDESRGR